MYLQEAIDFARNYARYNNDDSYLRAATLVEKKLMGHVVEDGAVFPADLHVEEENPVIGNIVFTAAAPANGNVVVSFSFTTDDATRNAVVHIQGSAQPSPPTVLNADKVIDLIVLNTTRSGTYTVPANGSMHYPVIVVSHANGEWNGTSIDMGLYAIVSPVQVGTDNVLITIDGAAEKIIAQRANTPAYISNTTRQITVNSQAELNAKLTSGALNGGDSLEIAAGLDLFNGLPDLVGVVATQANPIHIIGLSGGAKPIIRGSGNRQGNAGSGANRYRVLSMQGCAHITVANLVLRDAENMGIAIGSADDSSTYPHRAPSHNITLYDVDITNIRNSGLKVLRGSTNFKMIGGSITDVGRIPYAAGSGDGEGAYHGAGAGNLSPPPYDAYWASHDCEYVNVNIARVKEAFDIKRHSSRITFDGCSINDCTLSAQGAFTIAINPRDEAAYANYDVGVLIKRCIVWNMKSAINTDDVTCAVVGAGQTRIEDCLFINPPDHVITVYQDARNSIYKTLTVSGCILVTNRSGKVCINRLDNTTGSGSAPLTLNCSNNVVTVPVTGTASNTGEIHVPVGSLGTFFQGTQADIEAIMNGTQTFTVDQALNLFRRA